MLPPPPRVVLAPLPPPSTLWSIKSVDRLLSPLPAVIKPFAMLVFGPVVVVVLPRLAFRSWSARDAPCICRLETNCAIWDCHPDCAVDLALAVLYMAVPNLPDW